MDAQYTQGERDRFWRKVDRSGTCWLWTAARRGAGYGSLMIRGRPVYAHRISWQIANGAIPDGLNVLHNCPDGDNPACVNPAHLRLGTPTDNANDMHAKGRHAPHPKTPIGQRTGGELTTAEAAAQLGVTSRRIRTFIAEGRLPAEHVGRDWLIRESDLERARERKVGRPRLTK